VARALAARYGLRRFALDSFWYAFLGDRSPKSPDQQWLLTPPEGQAAEFERADPASFRPANATRELVDEVAALLDVREGPIDLHAARRWENEAAAENRRAWIASGDHRVADDVPFTWVCECGRRGCDATVRLTLAEYERGGVRSAH
jgi:hypothetical protein